MMTAKLRFVETDKAEETTTEKKTRLRRYMKERRGENENRDSKEALLVENFYEAVFGETNGAGTRRKFFIYLSFSSEAPTDKLIEKLKEDGYTVYCPRIENGEMIAVEYGEDFTLSEYGIREPVGEKYEGGIDVAVIPFLAVDANGNRLGYGGGYYDRYLARSSAKRVALGYDFQIVKEVPSEPWDEKMHIIVTDKRLIFVESCEK